jgi:hypothetical protein
MSKISLPRLMSRLTAFALSASSVSATAEGTSKAQIGPVECEECGLAADRPIDREDMDPDEAGATLGRSLALALIEMRPLHATQLVATCAVSDDPLRRLAVAHALEWTFRLVGDALAIDHLSRDADPVIRAAAARAAWSRLPAGGDLGILDRLTGDPDPMVRTVALAGR